jgi:transcriptional regulator with GAF, ATPase, and Fis domain
VGASPALTDTLEKIQKVGASNAGVLLLGESGTGKELMARAIHENSSFSKGLFVDINCGAIPENLQESELFGHNKGSFTGATETRKGRLELADGGTLFLDEVAEMSLKTQVKLLRYLQEKSFERVGGVKKIFTSTRVIAATNKDLDEKIKDGSFRQDPYW